MSGFDANRCGGQSVVFGNYANLPDTNFIGLPADATRVIGCALTKAVPLLSP
jgi:hypothetical protein